MAFLWDVNCQFWGSKPFGPLRIKDHYQVKNKNISQQKQI